MSRVRWVNRTVAPGAVLFAIGSIYIRSDTGMTITLLV